MFDVVDMRETPLTLITLAGHRRGYQGRPDCHNCELQRFQVFAAQISNNLSAYQHQKRANCRENNSTAALQTFL